MSCREADGTKGARRSSGELNTRKEEFVRSAKFITGSCREREREGGKNKMDC